MRHSIVNYLSVEKHDSKTSEHICNTFLYKTLKQASIKNPAVYCGCSVSGITGLHITLEGKKALGGFACFCFLFSWQWGGGETSPDLFKCL